MDHATPKANVAIIKYRILAAGDARLGRIESHGVRCPGREYFEAQSHPSSKGWIADAVKSAREESAMIDGIYFPMKIAEFVKRRSVTKTNPDGD